MAKEIKTPKDIQHQENKVKRYKNLILSHFTPDSPLLSFDQIAQKLGAEDPFSLQNWLLTGAIDELTRPEKIHPNGQVDNFGILRPAYRKADNKIYYYLASFEEELTKKHILSKRKIDLTNSSLHSLKEQVPESLRIRSTGRYHTHPAKRFH